MLDLSRLLDSNSRAALGQLIATAQGLVSHLARFRETGVVDDEPLPRAFWDLAEDLSISAGDLRKQLAVKDGASTQPACRFGDC